MAPTAPASGGHLNIKRCILAALTATLAAAVVVTVFSVVLSPARVQFTVTKASSHLSRDSVQLNLTLAVDNPSRRAAVTYRSVFVDVSNSTGPQFVNWVRANVTTRLPLRQSPSSVAAVDATVSLVYGPWTEAFTGHMKSSFTVMVTTVARFHVGVARTRLYDIKVSCGPVSFFPGVPAGLPVGCA